jgi:signal transduction histidine kinase
MSSNFGSGSQPLAALSVPDSLRHGPGGVENLLSRLALLPDAGRYVFDMRAVRFIEPCGAIALLSAVRYCATGSGRAVLMKNIDEQIYLYLERMNFFQLTRAWLKPVLRLNEEWSRNPHSLNLLELTEVTGYDEMSVVIERARDIFKSCLSPDELADLLRVISELCQNIYQHSGDAHGCIMIQKYQPDHTQPFICLSVGDSGCGIRANLIKRYPWLGNEPIDFVRAAMDGSFTSRLHGRGGLGLRTVRDISATHKGYVTVRSETAAVTDWGKSVENFSNLSYVAGTQVSVRLSARPSP